MELFHRILRAAVEGGASDVHLKIGSPVTLRVNRQLLTIEAPTPTADWINSIIERIVPKHGRSRLEEEREVDFSYFAPGLGRFRTNVFQQRGEFCLALRFVKTSVPSLEELGHAVGCSPFHLSRTFSSATGMTIPQYVRQLRMERAAVLLRSGRFNVSEAALEVGYLSLSHFSQAFHDTFGCCPGLYPLRTPTQKSSLKRRR